MNRGLVFGIPKYHWQNILQALYSLSNRCQRE